MNLAINGMNFITSNDVIIRDSRVIVNGRDITPSPEKFFIKITCLATEEISDYRSPRVVDVSAGMFWERKFAFFPVNVVGADGSLIKIRFQWYECAKAGDWDDYHLYERFPGSKKAYRTHHVGW